MSDDRPSDWNWVKATHECSAQVMFGKLMTLAAQNVQERNQQLGKKAFDLVEFSGIEFGVGKVGPPMFTHTVFKVTDDLKRVSIRNGQDETVYEVGLSDGGICMFRNGAKFLDPWQVLKTALQLLLFE